MRSWAEPALEEAFGIRWSSPRKSTTRKPSRSEVEPSADRGELFQAVHALLDTAAEDAP